MDNGSSFIPTSLPQHSLALLSQTNSLVDALRIPRVFPTTQGGDGKEMQHHPAYSFSMRQDYPGILSPVTHTFFPHFLDPRLQFNSAFRPLGPGEDAMKAFQHFGLPAGMKKPDLFGGRFAGQFPFFGATQLPPRMSPREMTSPQETDERSAGTPSSDGGTERSSPDDLKRRGLKRSINDSACPVCGLTVRPQDIESHFANEIVNLERLTKASTPISQSPMSESPGPSGVGGFESVHDSRWETLQRIRTNRSGRARCKSKRRRDGCDDVGRCLATDSVSCCPVCNGRIPGTQEDFSSHIVLCARKPNADENEDEPLDVDGDSNGSVDWKESSHLSKHSFSVASLSQPHRSRGAPNRLSGSSSKTPERQESPSKVNGMGDVEKTGSGSPTSPDTPKQPPSQARDIMDLPEDLSVSASPVITQVVTALKSRIVELEVENKEVSEKFNCCVCHNRYVNPLVSTSCWHIHCEECWIRTLGTKRQCPQCSTAASTSDLRKLFL